MGDAHEKNFPQGCCDRSYDRETYLRGLFEFVAQQKLQIDALSRKKVKDVFFKAFFSLLGIRYDLSNDERSLHFGSHCTVFTREKSRWLTVAIL